MITCKMTCVIQGILSSHYLYNVNLSNYGLSHVFKSVTCRNPTLAKCGGEAQHLEKVRIWSPPGLPNVQSSTEKPKTPCIGVFLVSLERS